MDVWSPDIETLQIRLVDFGGDGWSNGGNDSEGFKDIDLSGSQGSWVRLSIPLSEFVGLAGTSELSQMLLKATANTGSATLYVDNVYFFSKSDDVVVSGSDQRRASGTMAGMRDEKGADMVTRQSYGKLMGS